MGTTRGLLSDAAETLQFAGAPRGLEQRLRTAVTPAALLVSL